MKSEGSADRAVHVQTARRLKTLHVHRSTKKDFRNVRRFSRNIFTRFILSSQKPRKMGGLLYIIGLSLAPREKSTLCNIKYRQGTDGKSSVGLSNTLPAQFLFRKIPGPGQNFTPGQKSHPRPRPRPRLEFCPRSNPASNTYVDVRVMTGYDAARTLHYEFWVIMNMDSQEL